MDPDQTAQPAQLQAANVVPEPQAANIQVFAPSQGDGNGTPERNPLGQIASAERLFQASQEGPSSSVENQFADFERALPPPPRGARGREGQARVASRRQATANGLPTSQHNSSGLDWIVPMDEKGGMRRTIGERLQPTIDQATIERDKFAQKSLWTGYTLNIAIGVQVLLGALTTGLGSAITDGNRARVATAILGGLATLVASYLARARGSGEPELSIARTKDLEQFLRECKAFQLDHAHEYGTHHNGLNHRLHELRRRFEELLGNADGTRKLSPVGITPTQVQGAAVPVQSMV